mmetsp:Transcript_111230/g.301925  ORF Transcript_111230/g.301925 Transcript_111230/m.301925 type:complete len:224 (-) Transcript_111230:2294-2965(-)
MARHRPCTGPTHPIRPTLPRVLARAAACFELVCYTRWRRPMRRGGAPSARPASLGRAGLLFVWHAGGLRQHAFPRDVVPSCAPVPPEVHGEQQRAPERHCGNHRVAHGHPARTRGAAWLAGRPPGLHEQRLLRPSWLPEPSRGRAGRHDGDLPGGEPSRLVLGVALAPRELLSPRTARHRVCPAVRRPRRRGAGAPAGEAGRGRGLLVARAREPLDARRGRGR